MSWLCIFLEGPSAKCQLKIALPTAGAKQTTIACSATCNVLPMTSILQPSQCCPCHNIPVQTSGMDVNIQQVCVLGVSVRKASSFKLEI